MAAGPWLPAVDELDSETEASGHLSGTRACLDHKLDVFVISFLILLLFSLFFFFFFPLWFHGHTIHDIVPYVASCSTWCSAPALHPRAAAVASTHVIGDLQDVSCWCR